MLDHGKATVCSRESAGLSGSQCFLEQLLCKQLGKEDDCGEAEQTPGGGEHAPALVDWWDLCW